jgi:HEAT repeat protein
LRPLTEANDLPAVPERAARRPGDPERADLPPARPLAYLDSAPVSARSGQAGTDPKHESAGLETVELMRRLQSSEEGTVAQARAELVRRGFTETHLALARHLFDPDPAARRRLIRLLMRLPNVDAVPWLLQLSRDENADVRHSAISLLATTDDPALVEAIETIARKDPDPRVRRQAERLARQRRAGRY